MTMSQLVPGAIPQTLTRDGNTVMCLYVVGTVNTGRDQNRYRKFKKPFLLEFAMDIFTFREFRGILNNIFSGPNRVDYLHRAHSWPECCYGDCWSDRPR